MNAPLVWIGRPLVSALLALAPQQTSVPPKDETPPSDTGGRKRKPSGGAPTAPDGRWVRKEWPATKFRDVAKQAGLDCVDVCGPLDKPRLIDTLGSGMCWFDYDGDGWLDLFVPNGSTLDAVMGEAKNDASDHLYRNRGDGTFEDVTDKAGVHDDRWSISAEAGDYDNDGDEDLFVCNFGPCFLYRNNGDGTFTDVAKEAGVQFGSVTPGAAWGDIDGDGDLDLYVSAYIVFDPKNPWPAFAKTMRHMKVMLGPQGLQGDADRLYRNDGNGRFTDISKEAGLRTTEEEHGFTIQMVDLNQDDLLDIFVANDMTPNHHYRAVKPGKFTPSGFDSGLAVDHDGVQKACMGVALADLNDDQIPDFFITNFSAQTNDLYLSQGENSWNEDPTPTERAHRSVPDVGWGTGFFDFDLDGDEDLVLFNGHVFPQVETEKPQVQEYYQLPMLYRRDGPLKFFDAAEACGPDFYAPRSCRGAGFADYDDDGDVDIALFQMDKVPVLLRNEVEHKGHFVRVQLLGTTINRDAYGSRIVLEADGQKQTRWILGQGSFISQNDPRAFFGLGPCDKVDRITVRWTGGKEEVIEGPPGADGKPTPLAIDRTIVIKEGMGRVAELTGEPAAKDAAGEPATKNAAGEPAAGDATKRRTPQLATRRLSDELQAKAKGAAPAAVPAPQK